MIYSEIVDTVMTFTSKTRLSPCLRQARLHAQYNTYADTNEEEKCKQIDSERIDREEEEEEEGND